MDIGQKIWIISIEHIYFVWIFLLDFISCLPISYTQLALHNTSHTDCNHPQHRIKMTVICGIVKNVFAVDFWIRFELCANFMTIIYGMIYWTIRRWFFWFWKKFCSAHRASSNGNPFHSFDHWMCHKISKSAFICTLPTQCENFIMICSLPWHFCE